MGVHVTREELTRIVGDEVAACAEKLHESLMLGKPGEAADYASALSSAAMAYSYFDDEE